MSSKRKRLSRPKTDFTQGMTANSVEESSSEACSGDNNLTTGARLERDQMDVDQTSSEDEDFIPENLEESSDGSLSDESVDDVDLKFLEEAVLDSELRFKSKDGKILYDSRPTESARQWSPNTVPGQ